MTLADNINLKWIRNLADKIINLNLGFQEFFPCNESFFASERDSNGIFYEHQKHWAAKVKREKNISYL